LHNTLIPPNTTQHFGAKENFYQITEYIMYTSG
jgi:hypothetical protein